MHGRVEVVVSKLGCVLVDSQIHGTKLSETTRCLAPAESGVHVVIHGMGGLGKTTLAHYAYNSVNPMHARQRGAQLPCTFIRCNAEVGREPTDDHISKVQHSILEQLTGRKHSFTPGQYADKLSTAMDSVSPPVFLFLDNIWDSSTLQKLLPAGTALPPGYAVLATTRQADVAEVLSDLKSVDNELEDCNYQEYQADLLSRTQAQQLFHRLLHQSPTKTGSLTQEQEDGIVGLCGNHPLLLTVMVLILRKHPTK